MGISLRVLIIEDSEDDALLLVQLLKQGGYDVSFEWVKNAAAWESALKRQSWDIVLADYSVPGFGAMPALRLFKEKRLDLPFIIVSDAIGEENVVQAIKAGAHDYILKDNLIRLIPAVERELAVAKVWRERKRIEEALRKSETQVRRKLDAILLPEADSSILELSDIIDSEKIQKLMDEFYRLTNIGIGIIDLHGKVLVETGWQDICTKFHRVNPESCRLCKESDLELSNNVPVGTFKLYHCKNNMWDVATPIMLGDKHVGNIFLGQFLFDDETPDYEMFRQQARKFGFNEQEYIAALDKVPRWSRETVNAAMSFYTAFAGLIGNLSYSNIKLANALEERKRAGEALRVSERRLATLMSNLPGMAYRCKNDPNWTMEFVSDGAQVLTGYPAADLQDNRVVAYADLVHPADRVAVWNEVQACLERREPFVLKYRLQKANGEERWVWEQGQGVFDTQDRLLCLEGFITDVTAHKRAEEALKLNSERSATLLKLNQMTDATLEEIMEFAFEETVRLTRSKIGYLGFMNEDETIMNVHVWSRNVMPECNVSDSPLRFPVETAGLWGEAVRQRRAIVTNDYDSPNPWKKGCPVGHINLLRHMNIPVIVGSRIVLIAGVGNKEDDYDETDVQQLTLLMEGMWRLIDHRKAEEVIRETNERFRSVLRAATAYSIISMDQNGIIKVFNEGAKLMLGYSAEEVIDKVSSEVIHDPAEVAARAAEMGIKPGFEVFVSAARRGETETREWTYIRKDGSRLTVSLTVTAMRSKTGLLTGFTGIARDVTAEKKMEQQLLQSQKMETVGLLAGGVAHDFNNLLTPILGYTDMLLLGFSKDDPRYRRLQQVKQAADRAKELTQRLLAFSRKQIIELKTVDLGDIIRRFESLLHRTIRENIVIKINICQPLSLVRADASQIEQVLLNLAINAQDAMPEGGLLTIGAGNIDLDASYTVGHPEITPGPYVMLVVSDTGVGMDEKIMEHLFEPFFTTKELGKGTGLGLSTVYGIVKQHGGSICVYSEKNRGSVFKMFLPRMGEGVTMIESQASLPNLVAHGIETILVVEDDEMVRDLANDILKNLGYQVITSETPDRCIDLVKKYPGTINLLLTDLIMPGMNGVELLRLLRQMRPNSKVLFMSGYTSNVIAHHGVLDENVAFIQKPFTMHVLSEKVRQVLDS